MAQLARVALLTLLAAAAESFRREMLAVSARAAGVATREADEVASHAGAATSRFHPWVPLTHPHWGPAAEWKPRWTPALVRLSRPGPRPLMSAAPEPITPTQPPRTLFGISYNEAIRSPLRWIGPYPAIALSLPDLATPAQRQRGDKGVTLDFVVDTAANVNTINAQVAQELALTSVGSQKGGVGAGGALAGGTTYLLGTVEFGDLPAKERFKVMTGLTASALPVASPAAAGILGLPFLFSFRGGIEFIWGRASPSPAQSPGLLGGARRPRSLFDKEEGTPVTPGDLPAITFFGDMKGIPQVTAGLHEVPCEQLPSGLVKVDLTLNGVVVPALLDTGSPITVLNAAAAKATGLQVLEAPREDLGSNPFKGLMNGFKEAREAASGEVLRIAGAAGQPIELRKGPPATFASLGKADLLHSSVDQQPLRCYVGDFPGLTALGGLGDGAEPAAVLGQDLLRRFGRLVLTDNRVLVG